MKIDWKRVIRTAIQSATGAGVALITALAGNFTKEAVVAAFVQFGSTVAIAVLMNINKQAEEKENEEK